jgi:hypothetical protein
METADTASSEHADYAARHVAFHRPGESANASLN